MSTFHKIGFDLFEKFGVNMDYQEKPFKYGNSDILTADLKEAGYKVVKFFYLTLNPELLNFDEYLNQLLFGIGLI